MIYLLLINVSGEFCLCFGHLLYNLLIFYVQICIHIYFLVSDIIECSTYKDAL